MNYTCACCGALFLSRKSQSPQRDKGYGHCDDCKPGAIDDLVKYGRPGPTLHSADIKVSRENAEKQINQYA